jgi:hypothetical protein
MKDRLIVVLKVFIGVFSTVYANTALAKRLAIYYELYCPSSNPDFISSMNLLVFPLN